MRKFSVVLVLLFSIFFLNVPTEAAGNSQLIIINKKSNTLAFYDAGKLARTYSVATGKSRNQTPEGTFQIVTKIKNRPYYAWRIPGGDPRNPLGDRWMGLKTRGTSGDTYGIHGTSNESSIGKNITQGCVRMHNAEIHQLYEQVQLNTPVIITYSSNSFNAIAKANGYTVNGTNGWVISNGKRYYYINGKATTGWLYYGGKRYYLDQSGVMKTGWLLSGGKRYYLDQSGVMKTGWLLSGGKRYYLDQSGVMKTGWLLSGSKRYYLQPSGEMKTGWTLISGKWYFFDQSGAMRSTR
jgi:hypothetical protein